MRWLLLVALSMFLCTRALAQDVSRLYTNAELQEAGNRYHPNLLGLWEEDFQTQLTHDERVRAGKVTLNLPLLGPTRHPLEFYSSPARRQVFLPIASVKFADDLAVALAYYDKMGCDLGSVSDYAAVLRFRSQDVQGSPLETLGVPKSALNDPTVDDVAQKVLKSIVFFVVVHEYAHVMYRHKDYNTITAQQAQQQETEADAFALEIMRRIGVPPLGLIYFFLMASRLEATPGDFASPADYETYVQQRSTHPLSALRILKVAEGIDDHAGEFARLQNDPLSWTRRLRDQARQLREIAGTLNDNRMRLFLAQRAKGADIAAFRRACPR